MFVQLQVQKQLTNSLLVQSSLLLMLLVAGKALPVRNISLLCKGELRKPGDIATAEFVIGHAFTERDKKVTR